MMRYRDATAFRAAIIANLQNKFPAGDLNRLLKRVMIERFLARITALHSDNVLVKGGYALELRLAQARATQDLDLEVRDMAADEILGKLQDAGSLDLGDYMSFRLQGRSRSMPKGAPLGGHRLTVVPSLDGKRFQPFPLDVGTGGADLGRTEKLSGGIDLSFAGLPPLEVYATPLEVHLAEKLHALSVPRPEGRINTRVKDLIDVVLLILNGLPALEGIRTAVEKTFDLRGMLLPAQIQVPIEVWRTDYEMFAVQLDLVSIAPEIEDALGMLNNLVSDLRSPED